MSKLSELHSKWRHDPDYRAAYAALEGEFVQATALMETPTSKKHTKAESRKVTFP